MTISVAIPCYNEDLHIESLLIALSSYPSISEILVVDGMSTDKTRSIVTSHIPTNNDATVVLIDNPLRLQSDALNIAINACSSSFLVRIDAHLELLTYQEAGVDFFLDIYNLYYSGSYCLIGFRQRFSFNNVIQCSLFVLSFTPLLSRSLYRYANSPVETWDTAWLFALDPSIAKHIGGFRSDLAANEDYDFNQRLMHCTNKPILIYPSIPLYYSPRKSVRSLFIQYYKYGYSRVKSSYSRASTASYGATLCRAILAMTALLILLFFSAYLLTNWPAYLALIFLSFAIYLFSSIMDPLSYSRRVSFGKFFHLQAPAVILCPIIALLPSFAFFAGRACFLFGNLRLTLYYSDKHCSK